MNNITHPDKEIEIKVNFFSNYYLFVIDQLGQNSDFEIENIQSLVEKIIFQLEHNLDHSDPYLISYLTHPLIQTNDKYFQELKNYESISSSLEGLREILKSKKSNLKNVLKNDVLQKLKKYLIYLKKHMFKNALKSIISYLKCVHDLKEHKDDLKHFTKVIAVELYFQKKGKSEIKNIFEKIMSRDIEVFPFPEYLIKSDHNNLREIKLKFIENRTFYQQFEGIGNYLKKTAKKNYFIFRIGNIICDENFIFKFNDISFHSGSDVKILDLKDILAKRKGAEEVSFFDKDYDLFAIVKKEVHNERDDVKFAINKAIEYLNHINLTCNTSGYIDKNSYLFTEDFINLGFNISWSGSKNRLTKNSLARLTDTNALDFLEKKRIKSKSHFLNYENIYVKAKTNNNIDEYWRYLENLMQKPFKQKFIDLIEDELIRMQNDFIKSYIMNTLSLWNYNSRKSSFTFEEQKLLLFKMQKDDFDYNEILQKTTDEFLIDLIEYKLNFDKKNVKEYSLRILNEIYEQRNFIQHSNKIHEKSKLKLDATIPNFFMCFRSKLITTMILYPKLRFDEILLKF